MAHKHTRHHKKRLDPDMPRDWSKQAHNIARRRLMRDLERDVPLEDPSGGWDGYCMALIAARARMRIELSRRPPDILRGSPVARYIAATPGAQRVEVVG